jgi:hypothetical protein
LADGGHVEYAELIATDSNETYFVDLDAMRAADLEFDVMPGR